MIQNYLHQAMRQARYEILADDGSCYGEIPICPGVYANAPTLEACRTELIEVLEEWLLFRFQQQMPIPVIDGLSFQILEVA